MLCAHLQLLVEDLDLTLDLIHLFLSLEELLELARERLHVLLDDLLVACCQKAKIKKGNDHAEESELNKR